MIEASTSVGLDAGLGVRLAAELEVRMVKGQTAFSLGDALDAGVTSELLNAELKGKGKRAGEGGIGGGRNRRHGGTQVGAEAAQGRGSQDRGTEPTAAPRPRASGYAQSLNSRPNFPAGGPLPRRPPLHSGI